MLVCIISLIIIEILNNNLVKKTKYGNELYGKIKGFKNFLETVEKEKLEELVMENPKYFYDILPYTYVLEISDKWIEKFETISMKSPDWYDGNLYKSNLSSSINSISNFMEMTNHIISSNPSITSRSNSLGGGSSSSGGGFSGGGSGGGRRRLLVS